VSSSKTYDTRNTKRERGGNGRRAKFRSYVELIVKISVKMIFDFCV